MEERCILFLKSMHSLMAFKVTGSMQLDSVGITPKFLKWFVNWGLLDFFILTCYIMGL